MRFLTKSLYASVLCLAMAASARAQFTTITQWNFNASNLTPSTGTGTAVRIGGTTETFAAGSPGDPAGTNQAWNTSTYPTQSTASGTAGTQINVSTLGSTGPVAIQMDFRQSGTASRYFQLLVTADGTNYAAPVGGTATFGTVNNNTATTFSSAGLYTNTSSSGSQAFVQNIRYEFASGSVYENNPSFGFRWVSVFQPSTTDYISSNAGTAIAYGTGGGTARFDLVTVGFTPVPEPTTILGLSALGMGGLGAFRRSRKKA